MNRVVTGGAVLSRLSSPSSIRCRQAIARSPHTRRRSVSSRPGKAAGGVDGDVVEAGQFSFQLFAVRAVGVAGWLPDAGRYRAPVLIASLEATVRRSGSVMLWLAGYFWGASSGLFALPAFASFRAGQVAHALGIEQMTKDNQDYWRPMTPP